MTVLRSYHSTLIADYIVTSQWLHLVINIIILIIPAQHMVNKDTWTVLQREIVELIMATWMSNFNENVSYTPGKKLFNLKYENNKIQSSVFRPQCFSTWLSPHAVVNDDGCSTTVGFVEELASPFMPWLTYLLTYLLIKNFCLILYIVSFIWFRPNVLRHSLNVRRTFAIMRNSAKSIDFLSVAFTGYAFKPYVNSWRQADT